MQQPHLPFLGFSFCLILLLFCSFSATAQRGNYNFLNFEQKSYYFGIALGVHQSTFALHRSGNIILNEQINTVESVSKPGMNLGIIGNLKVKKYFDFRFTPSLVFGAKYLEYVGTNEGSGVKNQPFETTAVELPFHIRYKSAPYKDKRLFVIAGMKYSFDLANNSRTLQANELVKISPTDFAFELGAGIQFFLPYFIFSPEIKWSQGISNIHIYDPNLGESKVLDKVLSRALTISLNFEG